MKLDKAKQRHPVDRIRQTAMWVIVSLLLLAHDVYEMRKWASEAKDLEDDLRTQHADELRLQDGAHTAELQQAHARIRDLVAQLEARPPAPPAPGNEPGQQ